MEKTVKSWMTSKTTGDILLAVNGLALVWVLNLFASLYFFRIDLTEEKRYTIKPQTDQLLKSLDDNVYVEVFLEGDLNPGFRRFQKSIRETLEEFRIHSGSKVVYTFTNPATATGQKARNEFMTELASKGIQALPVIETRDGERSEKIVFPGALISYQGFETGVMLFKGNRSLGSQEVLNESVEGVEFELANAIYKLSNAERKQIGLVKGHGELDSLDVAGLRSVLLDQYDVSNVLLTNRNDFEKSDVLIIAKPKQEFSDLDKYNLDQYLMRGGKILFLIDELDAVMDSASREDYFAFPYHLKLEDQLFRYGLRINPDLVQDRVSAQYPVVTGVINNRPQIMRMDWPFFPQINQFADHPITRNLDAIHTRFISTLDTVKANGVKKTPLLFTSPYSRKISAPVKVSVADLRKNVKPESFNNGNLPVAYLLEGRFTSLYKNRFAPEGADTTGFMSTSNDTKIIVVADGDIARNDVNMRTGQPQQLGYDAFMQYTFANQDLLLNMVAFLSDENGLIKARNKEVKVRPLDREKVRDSRTFWQLINLLIPVLTVLIFGILLAQVRKRRYARF